MIKRVQLIGHITSAADLFLGKVREITVDITLNVLRLHDGATVGGIKIARQDVANVPAADAVTDGKMTASQAGDLSTVIADFATHDGSTDGHPVATPSVDGFMDAADKTILDGIEAGATADQTPAEILADLLTVDGASSGLDADLLDGLEQTSAATADTIIRRDSAGRAKVATPDASTDIATKGYADGGGLESTTVAFFGQATAPTGWVKDTDENDKSLRVVTGGSGGTSAGATAFSSVFGSGKTAGGTTLTWEQSGLKAHSHTDGSLTTNNTGAHVHDQNKYAGSSGSSSPPGTSIGSGAATDSGIDTGSAGDHSHTVTGSVANNAASDAAQSHNHTLSLDIQYLDIIKCTKS